MSDSYLKILQWNCHSLYPKLSHFKTYIYETKPHIVCLTETWLKNDRIPNFINYSKYLLNRSDQTGGGIAILVRNDLLSASKTLTPFTNGKLEIQAITLFNNSKRLI